MNKKKYIDAGNLIKALNEFEIPYEVGTFYEGGYSDCVAAVKDTISDIPSADVCEVRRGEWIDIPFGCFPSEHGSYDGRTKCSACGFVMSRLYYKYCPHCGAAMFKNEV